MRDQERIAAIFEFLPTTEQVKDSSFGLYTNNYKIMSTVSPSVVLYLMLSSIHSLSCSGLSPTTFPNSIPNLKNPKVGNAMMWGISVLKISSSLLMERSVQQKSKSYTSDNSSKWGATLSQGPHPIPEKRTNTGLSPSVLRISSNSSQVSKR